MITSFIFACLLAAIITPIVIKIYLQRGWVDDPEDPENRHVKKVHTHPVPRGGGIIVFFAILIPALIFLQPDKHLIAILVSTGILALVGTIDDIFDIHPAYRLVAGLLAALIVVASGIGIAYITNPLASGVIHLNQPQIALDLFGKTRTIWVLADLFAVIFIVWNMNIVNWSKGVDGQMPGMVSIAMIFIGILSMQFVDDPTQFNTAIFSFIVAGAFLGLLFWNWYPQKIMPGYGAGSIAGFLISVSAIISGAKIATALMVLGVPTADAIFTILRRLKAGKSPIWGDRGHLHHKLLDVLKWDKRKIAIFYWLSSFLLGLLALTLKTTGKIVIIGLVTISVFAFLIWAKLQNLKKVSS